MGEDGNVICGFIANYMNVIGQSDFTIFYAHDLGACYSIHKVIVKPMIDNS